MKKNKNEYVQLQVGLFFSIGLMCLFLAIFLLGSRQGFFTDHYNLFCYFDDISGLRVGSPVQLAGIKVGFVNDISFEELVPTPNELNAPPVVKVKASLELDKKYQSRICSDSTASVVTEGLLGDRIVFLTVGCRELQGAPKPQSLDSGEVLSQVLEPKGFGGLMDQSDELIRLAQGFVKNTNTLVVNLNKVVQGIHEGEGLAHKLIFDKNVAQSLVSAQNAAQNLEFTTQNLVSITNKIDDGEGTVGALINDPSLYNDLKLLLGKANRNKLVRSAVRYTLRTKEESLTK